MAIDAVANGTDTDLDLCKHPSYWFDDGSLVLHVQDTHFRVHGPLLIRHSPFLASIDTKRIIERTEVLYVELPPDRQIQSKDVEALLRHMYHDSVLGPNSALNHVASVLRCSSKQQLDLPAVYGLARKYFEDMFASINLPGSGNEAILDALDLSKKFHILSVRRIVLYHIMTAFNLDDDSSTHDRHSKDPLIQTPLPSATVTPNSDPSPEGSQLSMADRRACKRLMTRIIDYFTPIIFTPATTNHMACTDVFADTWMQLVIQHAIENDSVYKPIEALERLKEIDWTGHGMCLNCTVDKRKEWTEEQYNIWKLIDDWILSEDGSQ